MKPFPLIADPVILHIPIEENNESLIDIKQTKDLAYGPIPETPLTEHD